MTIRNLYPDIEPTLLLDFAKVRALDPRVTFTRASSAVVVDENKVYREVTSNVPRFDHDPVTGESLGLLVEEQRTNGIINPRCEGLVAGVVGSGGSLPTNMTLTNSQGGITVTLGALEVRNGVQGFQVTIAGTATNTTTTQIRLSQASHVVATAGQSVVPTVFVQRTAGSTTNFSDVSWRMDYVGNGGQIITSIAAAVDAGNFTRIVPDAITLPINTTAVAYYVRATMTNGQTGSITLFIGWPQLELGAFATSPILPPVGSPTQSTRAIDSASMTGTNFSSWYRQDQGTVYCETAALAVDTVSVANVRRSLLRIHNGVVARGIGFQADIKTGSRNVQFVTRNESNLSNVGSVTDLITGMQMFKSAGAYSTTDVAASYNGSTTTVTTPSYLLPAGSEPTTMDIATGSAVSGTSGKWNGYIRKIAYYPLRVSNTELQSISR